MKVETRKVVILDTEDIETAKTAVRAALSVRNHEVKSDDEGDGNMDTIIQFLNAIIDKYKQL